MNESSRGSPVAAGPAPGQMLPPFDLPTADGARLSWQRFKGRRNLVLVFVRDAACGPCLQRLKEFATRQEEYLDEETQVIGILGAAPDEAKRIADDLRLPFPLLADVDGAVHALYGVAEVAVYVADRFGEVYERWVAPAGHDGLPSHEQVLARLRFIEMQCPECGAPEWPPA